MKSTVCFLFMLMHGAIAASALVNKTGQTLDSFLRGLLAEYNNHFEGIENESDGDRMQKKSMEHDVISAGISSRSEIKYGCAGTEIAFYAYQSSSECYKNGNTFKFNIAPVNIGKGYNHDTGIFVVPETGLYAFTWTVVAEHGTWFSANLMVNSIVKGSVMADADVGGSASGIHPATGFVLTYASKGQHVYIQFRSGHGCTAKSDTRTRCTFTGWLMKRSG